MNIFLIRHGQSKGNIIGKKLGLIKGSKDDSSLTFLGKKQIIESAKSFLNKKIFISKIFTSPVKRAYQSALIFKKYFPRSELIVDENIKDIDFGDFENKSWEEIKNNYKYWLFNFLKDRYNTPFPNGESKKDLILRIKNFINNNLNKKSSNENYLIITHEEVIRCFLSVFFNNNYFFSRENLKTVENGKINSINIKTSIIYQINSNNPAVFEDIFLKKIKNFLKKENIYDFYLNKNDTYSDNIVFTVFQNKNSKKILKIFLKEKLINIKKENYLSSFFKNQNFSVPVFLKIKKIDDYFFCLREYKDEKLASDFFNNEKTKYQIALVMGNFLKLIHEKAYILKNDLKFKRYSFFYDKNSWDNFIDKWIKKDIEILKKISFSKKYLKKLEIIFINYKNFINNFDEGFVYYDFYPKNFTLNLKNNKLTLGSFWDFENSFWGDRLFDLAYTIKLSFFKNKSLINKFLLGYFGKNISKKIKRSIFFYLLIIVTGSITYKKERGIAYDEEIENLKFFLEKYLKIIYKN